MRRTNANLNAKCLTPVKNTGQRGLKTTGQQWKITQTQQKEFF
jgi:hypothetical protein